MRFFPEEGYKRFLFILLYTAIGIGALFAVFRYCIPALLPFLIAFPIAALLRRPTLVIAKHTRMPRRIIAALLAILCVSLLLFAIGFAVWKGIREIGEFARSVMSGENALLENLQALFARMEALTAKLPFSGGENAEAMRSAVTETILDMAKNAAASIGTKLPEVAGSLASAIPQVLVFSVVTILSSVYFCADYDRIHAFFRKIPLGKAQNALEKLKKATGKALLRVCRSYLILFLFTFAELFLGFVILGEGYAFLLALLTALVDSLPIFGTGTVLLPLALYRFFMGDAHTAIGLCVLYAIVTILRQILEPKILGAGIGMHPLLMLIAMYTGLKLFGILGMILFPIAAMIAKSILTALRPQKEDVHASS